MADAHWRIHRSIDPLTLGSITGPVGPTQTNTGIVSATAPLTYATDTIILSGGIRSTVTRPITNSAEFASLTSAQAASTSQTSSNTSTSTNAAATSSQSSTSSKVPLSTLIPAIVAPVVVLLISFIAFWWCMRRRTQKALEREPEFVMEGMKEKPRSRPVTADSDSSTQKLVPKKVKEATIDVKEVDRPSQDTFRPPKGVGADESDSRPGSASSSRPGSRQTNQDPSGKSKAIPNFSRGPRPGTAGRDSTASPAPPVTQRDRDGDRPGPRPPPPGMGAPRPANGPPAPGRNNPSSGPMPPNARARGPPPSAKGPPAAINTRPDNSNRGLMSPSNTVPAGAYNGSSPISQYSPIVKEMPKFGTAPMVTKASNEAKASTGGDPAPLGGRKGPPSAIKTANSPITSSETGFSEENMRIARLANNSRLGFSTATSPTVVADEPPTPSPRLPPPATRDAPPTNYNIPLPTHEPPAPASIQSRLNGISVSDRRSVVSGLSDDYVDMEVDDNKSDVSSLDEREKWQMETERAESSQGGLAGYGGSSGVSRPPLLSSPNPESGFSETSGSQYSLGKY